MAATADSELWPDDDRFRERWLHRPMYREMKPARVCGILRALEYAARGPMQGSNEVPVQTQLTVEHVMPQSWASVAGYHVDDMTDEQRTIRDIAIHRFGNLTLLTQPLNSSVSNGPFEDWIDPKGQSVEGKRSKLGQSALLINTYFNGYHGRWDDKAIGDRADALHAAAALVWSRPMAADVPPRAVAGALSRRIL
jgi:hypothetical protein